MGTWFRRNLGDAMLAFMELDHVEAVCQSVYSKGNGTKEMAGYRMKEAGIEVTVASMNREVINGKHGYEVTVNTTLDEVESDDYDILILPGGKAPAEVRKEAKALAIARSFFAQNKPVAAICHGPQILISADLLQARRATCYKTVVDELKAAGALYKDMEVVVDGNLITSRQPADLPAFMRETMKQLRF